MLDEENGRALPREAREKRFEEARSILVHVAGRLVEDEKLRLGDERLREEDAAKLAAGKLGEAARAEGLGSRLGERRGDACAERRGRRPKAGARRSASARKSDTETGNAGSRSRLCGT